MKKVDMALGLAFAALGGLLGMLMLQNSGRAFFYQNFSPEVVYFACGLGWGHPGTVPPALLDFLLLKTTAFDCSGLNPAAVLQPPGWFVQVQGYLSLAVGLIWRLSSPRYANLWPLAALLSGLYAAGCFALLRQFLGRIAATAGALLLTLSPLSLMMVIMIRDYSKAPFFIWALVFILQALRAQRLKPMLLWSAASAAMIGIGNGFRADIVMLAPLLAVTLLITFSPRRFAARLASVVLFCAVFLAAAYPILAVGKGSAFGSVILQGMSDPFRAYLQMTPAAYSFGNRYSDELVLSSIAADERPRHPEWDAEEGPEVYDISASIKLSGQHWQRILPLFPADFVAQAFKSAGWVLGMPALIGADHAPDPAFLFKRAPLLGSIMGSSQRQLEQSYARLGVPFLPWMGMLGMLVLLWRIWIRSAEEAVALAFLFVTLLTYPVVQFSIRHVFHLEFLWVLAVLALIELPFTLTFARSSPHSSARGASLRFAGLAALALAAGVGLYQYLASYQQKRLTSAFEAMLSAPREAIGMAQGAGTPVSIQVPVPPEHSAITEASPDSMTPRIRIVGIQWDVRSEADRLLLSFSGAACDHGIEAEAVYAKTAETWQPMDQTFRPLEGHAVDGSTLLFPAFYRPTQHLESVSIRNLPAGCSARLERLAAPSPFPALLSAALPGDWKSLPLRWGFGPY